MQGGRQLAVPLEPIGYDSELLRILAAHPSLKASSHVRGPGYEDPWNLWNGVRTVFSFVASLAPKTPGFIVWLHPHNFHVLALFHY